LLLISGLGSQLISWHDDFCTLLVEKGFRVIRFDNRDSGLSTKFDNLPTPKLLSLIWGYLSQRSPIVPYTLADMADDASQLLEAIGINSAHILGGSLGGMIALMLAILHPSKVSTLTILSSTAYDARVGLMQPKAWIQLKRSPDSRSDYVKHTLKLKKAMAGEGFPFDEADIQQQSARLYDRDHEFSGTFRQLAAILASSRSLNKKLQTITAPTLVIHGSDDPLLPVNHGVRLSRDIPNAELHIIEGLGHELPRGVWSDIVRILVDHTTDR
jgi:pimeloyl-ACP methyl ester carboxylesterase